MASAESEAAGEEADTSGEGDGTAGTFRDTLEPEDGDSGSQPDGVAGGRNAPGKEPVRSGS